MIKNIFQSKAFVSINTVYSVSVYRQQSNYNVYVTLMGVAMHEARGSGFSMLPCF